MLHVRYGYGHGRSLPSVICTHFVCIFVCLLKTHGYGQNIAIPSEIVGAVSGVVGYRSSKTSDTQWRRIFMNNNIFEGRLYELLQNYRHIHNVTSPGTGTDNSNRTAVKKEIETVNEWQRRRSGGLCGNSLFAERRPGCTASHRFQHKVCMDV